MRRLFNYQNSFILIMFFAYGLVWMDRYSIVYIAPMMSKEIPLSNTEIGMTMSVVAICWGISSIIFSSLSDILGMKKRFLILSLVIFSLSTLFMGFATSLFMLLLLRGIMGLAEGPAIPLIQSSVMAESSVQRRGFNIGFVLSGGALLGTALTPIYTTTIGQNFGWQAAFYSLAIPGLLIAVILMKFMREPKVLEKPEAAEKAPKKLSISDYKQVLKNRNIIVSLFTSSFYIAFLFAFNTFLPLYLVQVGGYSSNQISLLMGIYGIMMFVWSFVVPMISDRMGRKSTTIIFSGICIFLPIGVIMFHSNFAILLTILILLSAGKGYQAIIMFILPGESIPIALMATATSIIILIGELVGGSLGPSIAGYLSDQSSLSAALWFSAALSALVMLFSFGYKETAPQKIAKDNETTTLSHVQDL